MIQRLFDWMGRGRRTMPKDIEYVTMRARGQFLLVAGGRRLDAEIDGLAQQLAGVARRPRAQVESKRLAGNKITIKCRPTRRPSGCRRTW
jgi:hypothetical protein